MVTANSQHTPAPWIVYKGPMNMDGGLNPFFRGIVALLKHSGEDDDVCVILDRNEDAHDYEANARLIAAAPELLEELLKSPCHKATNFMVNHGEPSDFWVERINPCSRCAAIVKATGAQQ